MGPTRGPVIPAALARALSDRLYDKQRAATQKVEQMVRAALEADDDETIYALVAELATEFATSEREAARIGGLVALAATAVALTHINIRPFLAHMVPPMVSALSDGESKVRYFACESLYNVAKVSQGHILRWFNDIFDGLARVTADSVKSVKEGADYLDRLIKDIVAEQAATCLD
ncbi:PtdIns(3,5)P(2) sythesis regulation factor, partial [Coemansia nantahalensis]